MLDNRALEGKDRIGAGRRLACESFVSTPKAELVGRRRFPTREAVRAAIFEYIEGSFDCHGRRSSLGYASLSDYEAARMEEAAVAWDRTSTDANQSGSTGEDCQGDDLALGEGCLRTGFFFGGWNWQKSSTVT